MSISLKLGSIPFPGMIDQKKLVVIAARSLQKFFRRLG